MNDFRKTKAQLIAELNELRSEVKKSANDAMELKLLDSNIFESEANFLEIFELLNDGISVWERFPGSIERKLIYCNERYVQMAGMNREELLKITNTRKWAIHLTQVTPTSCVLH